MIRKLGPIALGLALAAACGGSTADDGAKKTDSSAGTGGTAVTGGTGGTHTGGTGGTHTGGTGGKPDGGPFGGTGGYIDPGCPDAAPPPPDYQCDPFGPNICDPGEGCYPYVIYPSQPCDQERYGTSCVPAGTGVQNEPCGSQACAAGYDCFITGQGTECLQLCQLGGANECPPGLLCGATDLEGFGACD